MLSMGWDYQYNFIYWKHIVKRAVSIYVIHQESSGLNGLKWNLFIGKTSASWN